jgi:hypothetical protein
MAVAPWLVSDALWEPESAANHMRGQVCSETGPFGNVASWIQTVPANC